MEQALLQSLHLKEPDAVIGYSMLIFNLNPSDPEVNLNIGTMMAFRGEWTPAEVALRKVLPSHQFSGAAHEILAQVLARQGRSTEAAYHYNEARAVQRGLDGTPGSR
jgi:uncharacterized protein HemY